MKTEDARDYILTLDLRNASAVIVDREAVDMLALSGANWPKGTPQLPIIPVSVPKGKTIHDVIAVERK